MDVAHPHHGSAAIEQIQKVKKRMRAQITPVTLIAAQMGENSSARRLQSASGITLCIAATNGARVISFSETEEWLTVELRSLDLVFPAGSTTLLCRSLPVIHSDCHC